VLLVDDDPQVRAMLAALLEGEFDVRAAASAEEARELLGRQPCDLILADQQMPGMTGVELLEWVRQACPDTVRLLMTGYAALEDAVGAINRGQVYRYLFKPWNVDELLATLRDAARQAHLLQTRELLLEQLRQVNRELAEHVHQRTRELEDANHQLQQRNGMLEKLALTDPLTGLPNRRAMDSLLDCELRRRSRYPADLTVALIDVDHFKEVNARYLLPGGDQVLVGLARSFVNAVRAVDSIGRVGGEEFLVVAPETGPDGAAVLGERMRATVEGATFAYGGHEIRVTVSLGLAVAPAGVPTDAGRLRHFAAAALAESKIAGRNRVTVHTLSHRPETDSVQRSLSVFAGD
jgi:diguanylate cyclase (GGDEF)-like protein